MLTYFRLNSLAQLIAQWTHGFNTMLPNSAAAVDEPLSGELFSERCRTMMASLDNPPVVGEDTSPYTGDLDFVGK